MLDRALELVGGPDEGGIAAVQNEFSARYRADADVLARCIERGIAFLAWSPLGGASQASELGSRYAAFAEVAAQRGISAQQVALAWLLALSPQVIPIPGSSRPATARSSAAAAAIQLSAEEVERLVGDDARGRLGVPRRHPRATDVVLVRRPCRNRRDRPRHRRSRPIRDVIKVIPAGV